MNNNKEMSLVKSFSIMFFILFVIGASTFAYLISHLLQQDMLEHSIHNVKNMVHSSFSNHYTSADFLTPKSGDEYERMKESMSHLSLDPNISKLKIWNTDMVLIWSDNKKYIGKKFEDNEDLKKVLKDITVHSGSHKTQQMYEQHNAGDDSEHNHADHAVEEQKQDMENILEYYIPIKFRDADSANIVVEVYHNYNNVIISGKRHAQQIWFWTFLFSVVAYVYLLALVRKASSRINKQTHALSETIETLTGEIDKREMIESKLKKASEDWRGTFNSTHDVIIMLDNEFNVVKMNRSGASLCNKKLTEVVGEYVDALFVDAELPEIGSYLLTAKRTKMREEIELSSDKSLLWYSISIDPILDDNRVSGFVLIIRDITDLKLMQTSLISSKKDWENTFDTITDIITIHDNDYNIINANKAGKEALSITDPSFLVKPKCFTMYHGVDAPPTGCPSCNCYNTKKSAIFEIYEPYLKKFVEIRSIPRLDDNGDLLGLIHVVRDISERKKDETLIETQIAHLNALSSIDKAIIGSMDINITLDIYLDQVIKQLEVDAATILILNPKTHVLLYINSKGLRTNALKNTRMKLGKSLAGRSAIEKQICSIPDLKQYNDELTLAPLLADENYTSYFAVPLIAKGEVKGVMELLTHKRLNVDGVWLEFLDTIATMGAIAIDNSTMFDDLQRSNVNLSMAYETTIEGWSRAMDLRDKETEGHSQRVTDLTVMMAAEMGVSDDDLVHIRRGALLHDMGKMGVPDQILLKPGKLTDEEWVIMKQHAEFAYDMLYPVEYLRPAIDIPYCHHEKWDGTGYPRGLKGLDIPIAARIFAIVDVWDALLSDRPYRPGWPRDKVLAHIKSLSGSHFDPEVVNVFIKVLQSIEEWSTVVT